MKPDSNSAISSSPIPTRYAVGTAWYVDVKPSVTPRAPLPGLPHDS
jgi:hypothetical protein